MMGTAYEEGLEQVRLLKINDAFRQQRLSDGQLQQLSRLALQAFVDVAHRWQLLPEDQAALLGLAEAALPAAWCHAATDVRLSYEQIERISYVLGIDRNLAALMPASEAGNWIRQPETVALFQQQPPLALMKTGFQGLIRVHNYLYGPLF